MNEIKLDGCCGFFCGAPLSWRFGQCRSCGGNNEMRHDTPAPEAGA